MRPVFYTPERGDIVSVTLSARAGHGLSARHPAVVLSPQAYNARVGLAILCPITPFVKGYPFEVPLPPDLPIAGAILADQTISLDWRAARAERIGSLPPGILEEALGKIRSLL